MKYFLISFLFQCHIFVSVPIQTFSDPKVSVLLFHFSFLFSTPKLTVTVPIGLALKHSCELSHHPGKEKLGPFKEAQCSSAAKPQQ